MVKKIAPQEPPDDEPSAPDDGEDKPTNAIVPKHIGNVLAVSKLGHAVTNLDLATFAGKAAMLAARSPGDSEFGKDGIARIDATHWVVFPDSGVDEETGEESTFVRTVLIDKSGRTFRTTAASAPERLADILHLFGPEEWAEGLPLVIIQRRSAKTGRTWHDIRVSPEREDVSRGQR